MKPRSFPAFSLLCLLIAAPATVHAHTPYLLPSKFEVSARSAVISAEASLTEQFFVPDGNYGAQPFTLTAPDGAVISIPETDIHPLAVRTVVEHRLPEALPGTYRLSAGPRVERISRSWEIDGELKRIRDPEEVMPEGAVLKSHSQSFSASESYITVGEADSEQVFSARGEGLEIVPISHPGQLQAGQPLELQIYYAGQPLPHHAVDLIAVTDFSGKHSKHSAETDDNGHVRYVPAQPGIYLASVRFSPGGELSAAKPLLNYSVNVSFQVKPESVAVAVAD